MKDRGLILIFIGIGIMLLGTLLSFIWNQFVGFSTISLGIICAICGGAMPNSKKSLEGKDK